MKFGVVENNDDSSHPDGYKLGRCQVRIFGQHTENRSDFNNEFEYLPISNLPWFEVLLPVTSAGLQYNYETPFIKNGSVVSIEYIDEDEQHGVIVGVLLRQPTKLPDFTKGFTDADENYPTSNDINKSPLYPYATGEVNTIVQNKINNVESSTLGFTEPITPYDPTYTKNKVISTKNHFIELDDTPGKERVHIYHKSGTFSEIHPDGTKVTNVKGSQYHIIVNDDNKKVNGEYNLDVAGIISIKTDSDANIDVTGDATLTIGNNFNVVADGDAIIQGANVILKNTVGDGVLSINEDGTIDLN